MAVFRRKASTHLIPVSPDSTVSKDWVLLLEAGTIVGPSPDKLRVARIDAGEEDCKKIRLPAQSEILPRCGRI